MSTKELAKAHRISIEFIGTDAAHETDYRPLYCIACSCGGLDETAALIMTNANRRIARHLEAVGLTESFTQHPA